MGRGREPIPWSTGHSEWVHARLGPRPTVGHLHGWGLGALCHSLFRPAFGRLVKVLELELQATVDK